MKKVFCIDLLDLNNAYESFANCIDNHREWCYQHGEEFLPGIGEEHEFDFYQLSEDTYDDVYDLKELEELSGDVKVILVFPDINSFKNSDDIRRFLKSNYNFLVFRLSGDESRDIKDLTQFILDNCN